MSRQTPRKRQHMRVPSGAQAGASDYESDAARYLAKNPPAGPPPRGSDSDPTRLLRTNTELNLGVLRRYLPSISAILAIAAHSVVYTFAPDRGGWDKSGVEGTMFVCSQADGRRACVFILNRRGLDNVIIDLGRVSAFEVTAELLNFRLEDDGDRDGDDGDDADDDGVDPRVLGLWIGGADKDEGTRARCGELIGRLWSAIGGGTNSGDPGAGKREPVRTGGAEGQQPPGSVGPAMQAVGRRLSLTDLFGRAGQDG